MNKLSIAGLSVLMITALLILSSCAGNPDDKGFNIFSIEDDKALGQEVAAEINNDPSFTILPVNQYPEAYSHMNRIVTDILNSGEVFYKDEFDWDVKIVYDDNTLNAFCAPGGYIYVYTGIIKFLDTEDQLAGVMGHEIAHADRRHVTDQLTKIYGISVMIDLLLGNRQNTLTEIAENLLFLSFSRKNETEADEYSVKYLCPTNYYADGAADFFSKMAGQPTPPPFLSTHPDPGNRVVEITDLYNELGCTGETTNDSLYMAFKNSLP